MRAATTAASMASRQTARVDRAACYQDAKPAMQRMAAATTAAQELAFCAALPLVRARAMDPAPQPMRAACVADACDLLCLLCSLCRSHSRLSLPWCCAPSVPAGGPAHSRASSAHPHSGRGQQHKQCGSRISAADCCERLLKRLCRYVAVTVASCYSLPSPLPLLSIASSLMLLLRCSPPSLGSRYSLFSFSLA